MVEFSRPLSSLEGPLKWFVLWENGRPSEVQEHAEDKNHRLEYQAPCNGMGCLGAQATLQCARRAVGGLQTTAVPKGFGPILKSQGRGNSSVGSLDGLSAPYRESVSLQAQSIRHCTIWGRRSLEFCRSSRPVVGMKDTYDALKAEVSWAHEVVVGRLITPSAEVIRQTI